MAGDYTELFTGTSRSFGKKEKLSLKPWEYLVFEKK
jgi:hypothetical protein